MNPVEQVALTVFLRDLVPGGNFSDGTFKEFVESFMDKFMPTLPIGMLEVGDPERFEVEVPCRFYIEPRTLDGEEVYVVRDTGYIEDYFLEEGGDSLLEDGVTACWHDEEDAECAAREADQEEYSHHGHPWANNTVYIPDERILTHRLQDSGFVVATYTGGDGESYRICGIDGGGYDFVAGHWAPLCAIFHEKRDLKVDTDNGPRFIMTEQ